LVQGGQQAAFANNESGAFRFLLGQKAGRRHGARKNVFLFNVDPQASYLGHHVPSRTLAVVGQELKRYAPCPKLPDKVISAWYEFRATVQDSVHVD
jgi:hypothetical protein